jgi:hypothetical protein
MSRARKSMVNRIGCAGRMGHPIAMHTGSKRGSPITTVSTFRKIKAMAKRRRNRAQRKETKQQ